jgi:hypothetical protein
MHMPEMNSPHTPPSRHPVSRWGLVVLWVVSGALVVFFHQLSGSARSELGSHPDEAAHFVTGLMVHDYIVSGFHKSPLRYADDYYKHYPKIGLGNWPPVFYVVQAVWMLVFPAGVESVLRLMELITLGLAMLMAWWLWRSYGWLEAATGAVLLVSLPLVQEYSNMVMAEVLCALLTFGAAGFFALFLEGEEWRGAIGFGICAGLAIMTKGTGLALALVPPLAVALTGRYELLKRRSLWVAAALVLVMAGPWTWHFRGPEKEGWVEPKPSLHFSAMAMLYYHRQTCVALGGMLALLALIGAVVTFIPKIKKPAIVPCSLALALGVWIFQCLTPVGLEARHLIAAMPALIVLAMTGLRGLSQRFPAAVRPAIFIAVVTVFFAVPMVFHPPEPLPGYGSLGNKVSLSPFRIPGKEWGGFEPIAESLVAERFGFPVLVASDARGEGMFIAEMAALDPHRPSYTIIRASKLLAASAWSGAGYQSFYQTPDQVRAAIEKAGIGLVVIDSSPFPTPPHEILLMAAMDSGDVPLMKSTATRDGDSFPGAIQLQIAPRGPN